ncbi:MAG: DUF1289 domain-containing protein [Methylomonas sp.]|nr:DUF1289 domain-containing protein [Methylomonas sp.]
MTKAQDSIPSPCIRNCCLNDNNICQGCFRSLDEICGWSQANTETRQRILVNVEQRRLLNANNAGTGKIR